MAPMGIGLVKSHRLDKKRVTTLDTINFLVPHAIHTKLGTTSLCTSVWKCIKLELFILRTDRVKGGKTIWPPLFAGFSAEFQWPSRRTTPATYRSRPSPMCELTDCQPTSFPDTVVYLVRDWVSVYGRAERCGGPTWMIFEAGAGVSHAYSPNDARHGPVEAFTDVRVDRLSAHIVPRHGGVLGS